MAAGNWAEALSSAQAIATTTEATLDFGAVTTDSGSILSASSGVYTPQSAGGVTFYKQSSFSTVIRESGINVTSFLERDQ